MFQHILFPTDGSPASEAALTACLRFARECGAKLTAVNVVPEFHVLTYRTDMLEDTRAQYLKESADHAARLLEHVLAAAREQQVPCFTDIRRSDHPYEAIIAAARDKGCDLIAMASHGYRGMKGLVLGSETHKVLVHSTIPVLVYRNE